MKIAVVDACVLFSAPLRDLFMRLVEAGVCRLHWTEQIHGEWIAAILKSRSDLSMEKLQRTRDLMDLHALNSLVTGYESLIGGLNLPDPDDRHVLAAAIHTQATQIVTFNLTDFPVSILSQYGIMPVHPDDFVLEMLQRDPTGVCLAISRQRANLKNPPQSVAELLQTFDAQHLKKTVQGLQPWLGSL